VHQLVIKGFSAEECYQHFVKCIQQAAKVALGKTILRHNTKLFYYWNEEIGKLVKKIKLFEMDYFKRPIGQDRPLKEARKN